MDKKKFDIVLLEMCIYHYKNGKIKDKNDILCCLNHIFNKKRGKF